MAPAQTLTLYTRTGGLASPSSEAGHMESNDSINPPNARSSHSSTLLDHLQQQTQKHRTQVFPKPSLLQRAYLKGVLYKPRDAIFLARLIVIALWTVIRLHCIELPFLILTRFKHKSKQHPLDWPWWWTIVMGLIRVVGSQFRTIGQLRFLGLFIHGIFPLHMLFVRHIKVEKNVQFKVNLEILLRPERASLAATRKRLQDRGCDLKDCAMNPTQEYLESMHPSAVRKDDTFHIPLANLPEEVGHLDTDGTYTLKGEWIEAMISTANSSKNKNQRRNSTVILYFHGGGHAFLSPASHRQFLSQLAKKSGPGTRIFSVDYRMAPEHPFPAAIHDAFAAYLYLTEPQHEALILDKTSLQQRAAVDPRDIVVGGDSAGGNLAAAFMLYLAQYVQPSTLPKYVMPHATLLLSAWTDPTSSLPAARSSDYYCYCPGPIGTNPFDKEAYLSFDKMHLASNYLCGDADSVPNPRNALGKERLWEWYSHLAQHPLVSPAHRTNVSELNNTLIQTGTHDRLIDDSRLYAHRLGVQNSGKLVRIEIYKDMVHVHQIFTMLKPSRTAIKNLVRFIERSKNLRGNEEGVSDASTEEYTATQGHYAASSTIQHKSGNDGVEWVTVEPDGKEAAKDEGWPLTVLINAWPANEPREM